MLMGEHAVVYGYPSLVTAVDQRISVSTSLILGKNKHQIKSEHKDSRFIDACVEFAVVNWGVSPGLEINIPKAFASTFGFGSSSAVTVACLAAIAYTNQKSISTRELFDAAYKVVLDVQKTGSGFDVAAAVYGGTLWYEKKGEIINALEFNPKDVDFIVGYSGVKADTTKLINAVAQQKLKNSSKIDHIFNSINALVQNAKTTIADKDWEKLGFLFNENQNFLRELEVSTPLIENLIASASNAGAYGAKLSGAGGGDCIIALAPKSKTAAVKNAIEKSGGKILEVEINAPGVFSSITDDAQELFVVVNENDEEIGVKTRQECHANKGLIHKAVEILLYNTKGELLLQKRSPSKDTNPGLWTVSASGHVAPGETYLQTALREVEEELGVKVNLEFKGKFLGRFENESEFLGVFTGVISDKITINQQEVSEVEFVTPSQLQKEHFAGKRKFSPGAIKTLQFMHLLT